MDAAISTIIDAPTGTSRSAESQKLRDRREAQSGAIGRSRRRRDRDPPARGRGPPLRDSQCQRAAEDAAARRLLRYASTPSDRCGESTRRTPASARNRASPARLTVPSRAATHAIGALAPRELESPRAMSAQRRRPPGSAAATAEASSSTGRRSPRCSSGVDQKAPAFADAPPPADPRRRTDNPRGVEHRRVQRDRVHQVLAADQLDEERLTRRDVEGVDDPQAGSQREDLPDLDAAGDVSAARAARPSSRHLRRHHDAVPVARSATVPPTGQPGSRDLRREPDGAEQRGRSGEPVDQPGLRHRLHPGADERDQLSRDEETIVGRPEGSNR